MVIMFVVVVLVIVVLVLYVMFLCSFIAVLILCGDSQIEQLLNFC